MSQTFFSQIKTPYNEEISRKLRKRIEEIYSNLGGSINNKRTLFQLVSGSKILETSDMTTPQKPETFTKNIIIKPLLEALEYEATDIGEESEQDLDTYRNYADYTLRIDPETVLVEAEPLNKDLRAKDVGLDQVKSWILSKTTETDFGIATNGFTWILIKYDRNIHKIRELGAVELRELFLDFIGQKTLIEKEEILKNFYTAFSKKTIISTLKEVFHSLEILREKISQKFYSEYMDFVFGVSSKTGSLTRRYCLLTSIKKPPKSEETDLGLFAVTLMNRLLFIKFLEDKGLVKRDLLKILWNDFSNIRSRVPGSFYKSFLGPLFFGVFNSPIESRTSRVKSIEHFKEIPYLNGGLFRETVRNESEYDVEDDILEKIIKDFLEKYSFTISGEEGLDPDILGNVFEKTINYISQPGSNAQKAKGAYYTPDDITKYITENTLHPFLLKQIMEELLKSGWKESELREYTTLESFLNNLPRNSSDIKRALGIIDKVSILDPACGSGHFLTSALKELVYVKETLLRALRETYSLYQLKKETIGKNLYGVDIDGHAVEIAKLRLWLSLIEDVKISEKEHMEALPNIEFNILQGDSLVGWIDEPMVQKPLFRLGDDEQIRDIMQELQCRYAREQDKLQTIERAKENFNSYEINKILESYSALRSIYPLESHENAARLANLLGLIRNRIYAFIGENYAKYLSEAIYGNKLHRSNSPSLLDMISQAFHWGFDFHSIVEKRGFDIVIGNPPYVETPSNDRILIRNYRTEECGNTHAFFFERALKLSNEGGYVGLIVPIASISTPRMEELQKLLMDESSNLRISSYDDRPGKLFSDLEHCRQAIIMAEKKKDKNEKCKVFTTKYNRWYTENREELFQNLKYVDSTDFVIETSMPKIGYDIEKSILQKIDKNKKLGILLAGEASKGKIWYHNAPQYWIRAMNFVPYFWNEKEGQRISSHLVELNVHPGKYAKVVTAVLNSSTFYWFFVIYSNGRDLTSREIENFPISIDEIEKKLLHSIEVESDNLMADYRKNARRKTCQYKTTGKVEYDEFYPGQSKPIIDRIDNLLARHYGFTHEERDFIKNYDIKFRLGSLE